MEHRSRSKREFWLPITFLSVASLTVLITFVWQTVTTSRARASGPSDSVPKVFVGKLKASSISNKLVYPAQIQSDVNASVRALGDGIVTKIIANLGKKVRQGQTILVMKHYDPVYQYAPLRILAPITGVVSQMEVTRGSFVTKGAEIATVTDPRHLQIVIQVVSADLHRIRAGQTGELTVTDQNHKLSVPVRVTGISAAVDPVLGTATCRLAIAHPTPKDQIFPGEVGEVQFQTDVHTGILIPQSALAYKGESTYVRVVNGVISKDQIVQTGDTYGQEIEITSGLKAGESVIERASQYVANGQRVKVETANE